MAVIPDVLTRFGHGTFMGHAYKIITSAAPSSETAILSRKPRDIGFPL